jgi:ubiquinone/menaquinone biosynthesis C-methylase UbiE
VLRASVIAILVVCSCGGHADQADQHDGMPHRFEHADDWAKVFDAPDRDSWQHPDDVLAALALAPGMTVADVGAGTGYFTVRLARAVPDGHVIATDIEPDMLQHIAHRAAAEHLANITTAQATADDPALPPASVDRVLIVDVWHHIADRRRYAAALARALKPGGTIAVVDFTAAATRGPPAHHRLPPEAIIADFRAAGLDASVSPTQLPEQYIVVATR